MRFVRTVLVRLIVFGALWACFIWITGGIDLRKLGIPFTSTNVARIVYATLTLGAVYFAVFRSHVRDDLGQLLARLPSAGTLTRVAPVVVIVLSAATAVIGVTHGVFSARSADEYGYLSQADLWRGGGNLVIDQPIAREVPWPDPDWTFSPMGYRPLKREGTIGPFYAPGLPVLMAAGASVAGECGKFLVTPLLGGLMIWLTYLLGTRLWSAEAGVAAAILMCTSPTFLFMLVQPMSDVPAASFFTLGLVLALSRSRWRSALAGAAVSLGVFVRPNLLPLGFIVLIFLVWRAHAEAGGWRAAARAAIWYCAGGAPLVLSVAVLNTILYGAPWSASYGDLGVLFSWSYPLRNIFDYGRWLWQTETPFVLLAAVPLLMWRRVPPERRRGIGFVWLFGLGVFVCYLFYLPLGVWWYLRFLLPAFPVMLTVACIGLLVAARLRLGARASAVVLFIAVVVVVNFRIKVVRSEPILTLWRGGVSYVSAAEYVRTQLPENAVVLAFHHAGSVRYYAHRLTMRWDLLSAEWWPRALDVLVAKGYRPYLLVADFEEPQFRQRFGLPKAADAPGEIIATLTSPEQLRIYDPLRLTAREQADRIPQIVARPCTCWWNGAFHGRSRNPDR